MYLRSDDQYYCQYVWRFGKEQSKFLREACEKYQQEQCKIYSPLEMPDHVQGQQLCESEIHHIHVNRAGSNMVSIKDFLPFDQDEDSAFSVL